MNKHLVFEELYDFWNFAFRESEARRKASREQKSNWNGDISWNKTKKLAFNGWKEGLKEIEKYQANLNELTTSKIVRQTPSYAVAGSGVSVGNYLSNDPECFVFREYGEIRQEGKIIKLVCSISFSAAISASIIMQRGAMICALVDAIEYAGYRAEVICNLSAHSGKGSFEVDVTIKKANQPLNRIELAFCLAHPAMLRRVLFSVAEIEGWSDFANAYGCPSKASNPGDFYIDEIFSAVVSNDKAVEWLLSNLAKLGISIDKSNL